MIVALAAALVGILEMGSRVQPASYATATGLRAAVIASGLDAPLFVTTPPGDPRLFVVEQPGRIRVIRGGHVLARPFLDLTARVAYGGERGLLGLAFHPAYARNGWFFVDYTDVNGDTRVERYHVGTDPDVADPASGALVLQVAQPFANHNGGMLAFGPDGGLFVGMGDGGSGGDPHGNGQNDHTLLAKMLRLDVNGALPCANPGIWAKGLRNPWRFAFDRGSPLLYIADVGQNSWEEIDVVDARRSGYNFGWNLREGLHAYRSGRGPAPELTDPVLDYSHADGCSVTGGYCYRGRALAGLQGTYFFSDYCRGWLRSFRWEKGRVTELRQWSVGRLGNVTSFGEDAEGELYVTTGQGSVLELVPDR